MPGTLVHTGVQHMQDARITVHDYDGEQWRELTLEPGQSLDQMPPPLAVRWVNVDGLHDVEQVRSIGQHFGVHPLALEDIVQVGQRPKQERYEGSLYLVMSMLRWDSAQAQVVDEQVSLLLGPGWVLTFQEREGDVFDPVRHRLRSGGGTIRRRGADYLFYALIDVIVDRYYDVLDRLGERAEQLELGVIEDPEDSTIRELYHLRRELIVLRRAVIPTGEVTHGLITSEDDTIHEHTRVFLRDVHDHALQIGDSVESLADLTKGLMDLYFSIVSNRANEVMKVLTVMATIFIPLTFVTGLYGMNFRYMPELEQPWAYPILLALMTLMVLAMIVWFRRLGWLGGHRRPRAQPQSLARNASSSSLRDSASSSPSSMSARR